LKRFSPFLLCLSLAGAALGQVRVVNYNTLDGPTPDVHDNSANMAVIFSAMASNAVNGIAKRPDLLILQEQTNASAANLAATLNALFPGATYLAVTPAGQPGSSDPRFIDRGAFVYDSSTLTAVTAPVTVSTGAVRPVIRGQFRPVGYSSAQASFFAYGAHLKSGTTVADRENRALQTSVMRANADALGNVHTIFAGDFNMQNNQEQGWLNLVTGAGAGLAIDPLNPTNAAQTWNNNAAFASIHTQSTRTSSTPDGDGGATGGMDDRFDVQLSSAPFHDGEGLSYIANSTRAFGNDGQHFNLAINASPTIPLGATVANALWDASDHLPVVADYQLPARMAATISTPPPPQMIVGGQFPVTVNVRNTAPVATSNAADELDYQLTVGTFSGSYSTLATTPGNEHAFEFSATSVGNTSLVVPVTSSSQGVEGGAASLTLATTVKDHAHPSFLPGSSAQNLTIDFGIRGLGEAAPADVGVELYNRTGAFTPAFTAGLDLDAVDGNGDVGALTLDVTVGGTAIPAGQSRSGMASFAATSVGAYSAIYSLLTSDEDLPGATSFAPLTVQLSGRIALFGDATLDNAVNLDDFTALAAAFGGANQTWQTGDFTHDGLVNLDDFTLLAAHFGETAMILPRSVPEPSTASLIMVMSILSQCRTRCSAAAEWRQRVRRG